MSLLCISLLNCTYASFRYAIHFRYFPSPSFQTLTITLTNNFLYQMYISSTMLFSALLSYFCIFWHEKKCLIKSVWVIAFVVLSVSNFNYSNSHLYMVYIYLVENKINGLRLNFISFSCSVDAKKSASYWYNLLLYPAAV